MGNQEAIKRQSRGNQEAISRVRAAPTHLNMQSLSMQSLSNHSPQHAITQHAITHLSPATPCSSCARSTRADAAIFCVSPLASPVRRATSRSIISADSEMRDRTLGSWASPHRQLTYQIRVIGDHEWQWTRINMRLACHQHAISSPRDAVSGPEARCKRSG